MTIKRRAYRLTLKRPRDMRAKVYSWAHANRKFRAEFWYSLAQKVYG